MGYYFWLYLFFIEMGQDNDSNDSAKEFAKALSIIIFACFIGGKISDFIR